MKKALIIAGIVGAVIVLALIQKGRGNSAQDVLLETVQKQPIRASILASGKLSNEDEVLLSTEVIGKVAALYVKEGDAVTQGQLLVQIDDEALRATVEQQQASVRVQQIAIEQQKLRLANLQSQWERNEQLHGRGLLDDNTFEVATNDLELAKLDVASREASLAQASAMLAESEKNLSRTRVYSPIDGIVTSLDIEVGEMAIASTTNIAGSSLMTIANPESIDTEVYVDEADIADVAIGQEAEIVAIGYPDKPMKGVVEEIAITAKPPTANSQSLAFVVRIGFTDTAGVQLRPGMSSRAEIFTSSGESLLAVPLQAVLVNEDRAQDIKEYRVFKFDNGVARATKVDVGISDDTYQEITSGLDAGDRIITGPDRILRNLEDGDAVQEDVSPDDDEEEAA
ncbi:MAG: efflux RND transporter periplasmic adaptor subunit [Gammaproteobacteria bacterium]